MPLSHAAKGQEVVLESIDWGQKVRKKLQDMGLTPGVRFKVVSSGAIGPMIIDVRGTRVAIGRGMLSKISVRKVTA